MMDKALKERIIGAIVLVVVAVLVVPVFLDGPPAEGEIISKTVPLPGQSEQKTQTVILDRDRDEPVPAQVEPERRPTQQAVAESSTPPPAAEEAVEQAAAAPVAEPVAAEPEPQPERQPESTGPETPAAGGSSTGMWAVQLGSFSNQANAEKLAADLRKQGFAAFLSQLSTSSGQLHRVRIGPQKDREAAEAMAARLQKAGHTGKVLPHP